MKESTRLEAALGRVREELVFKLIATYASHLAAEYVIPLTLEPLMMTFTVLSGVDSIG